MTAKASSVVLTAMILLSLGACRAKGPDLSGSWKLNVNKSHWGKVRKPNSVMLEIRHDDPALKYHGWVVDAESDGREFEFDGVINGQEQPVRGARGDGMIAFTRRADNVLVSRFKSSDGRLTEEAETSISADGRTLTRRTRLMRGDNKMAWTEVYERR